MEETIQNPLIIAFVSDLMFTTKIDNVTRHLGFRIRWVGDASEFGDDQAKTQEAALGEILHGPEGQLQQKLSYWQPALLLFDLANQGIPWRDWIPHLKVSAATRRIPILAYGPHVDAEIMQEARNKGADFVYPRSRFANSMPELLQKHAHVPAYEAINQSCLETLPDLAASGIKKFNEGAFYACHDDLEEAWRQEPGSVRDLYRGLLQVAIAYYQIERGNYRGATKMLLRMRQWLSPMPPICQGVNVRQLLEDATAVQDAVTELGPSRISEFDFSLLKPVELQE